MSIERVNHANRIENWFSRLMHKKYEAGQKEHGGDLWDKTGMLTHAIEEVIDLAVYLQTMEEQLTNNFPTEARFFLGAEKLAAKKYIRKMPRIYVAGKFRGANA